MPTYSWFCQNCETATDVTRSIAQIEVPPEEPCCAEPKLTRTPPRTSVNYGSKWSPGDWKSGGGGKGKWGQ